MWFWFAPKPVGWRLASIPVEQPVHTELPDIHFVSVELMAVDPCNRSNRNKI
jgi:hypothetical protein